MKQLVILPSVLGLLVIALSGCGSGGGSGLFGLFGQSSEEVVSELTNSEQSGTEVLASSSVVTDGSAGSLGELAGSSELSDGQVVAAAAVVHSPEPASLALFGGGLAGVAWLRRQRAKRGRG
jgi:hypothetical protein